jgi:hypothetical protein
MVDEYGNLVTLEETIDEYGNKITKVYINLYLYFYLRI